MRAVFWSFEDTKADTENKNGRNPANDRHHMADCIIASDKEYLCCNAAALQQQQQQQQQQYMYL